MAQIAVNTAVLPAAPPAAGAEGGAEISAAAAGLFSALLKCLQTNAESGGTETAEDKGSAGVSEDKEQNKNADISGICLCACQMIPRTVPEIPEQNEKADEATGLTVDEGLLPQSGVSIAAAPQKQIVNTESVNAAKTPDTSPVSDTQKENTPAAQDFAEIVQTEKATGYPPGKKALQIDTPGEDRKTANIKPGALEYTRNGKPAGTERANSAEDRSSAGENAEKGEKEAFQLSEYKANAEKSGQDAGSKQADEQKSIGFASTAQAGPERKQDIGTPEVKPTDKNSGEEKSAVSQIADFVKENISHGRNEFTISLKPEGLGSVTVNLSMKKEKIEMSIKSNTDATKELIAAQLGDLKNDLEANGYKIDSLSVTAEPRAETWTGFGNEAHSGQNGGAGGFTGNETRMDEGKIKRAPEEINTVAFQRVVFKSGKISYRI